MDSGSSTPPFSHTISHAATHHASISVQGGASSGTNLNSPLSHVNSNTKQFRRPDGKIVHVAGSPDEERKLRRRLTRQSTMPTPQMEKTDCERKDGVGEETFKPIFEGNEWDIVIHGSPEHIEALKETHQQAENLRNELKSKYGSDWEHMEGVIRELDRLNHELHMISQHSVKLDANFSKYGYGAHIRTLPGNGEESTAVSTIGDMTEEDWEAEKHRGKHIQFYRTPVMRQYFHKRVLWRASDAYEPTTYELFIDLLYVGIIAIAGDTAAEGASGHSLLVFAIAFTVTWKLWQDVQQFSSWISMDDVVRRLSAIFMLAILLGITINVAGSYDETYVPLVAFYIFGRWYVALYFVWMAYLMPIVRNAMLGSAVASAIPPFIWLGSIWVPQPARQALIWIALPLDIFGPVILVAFERGIDSIMPQWMLDWCHRTFEFMPGNNIEHRIERTNSFVGLVFGYSIVALLYQSRVAMPMNGFFGKAVLGLIQSFCFNWLYFEIDTFNMHTHAIRRHFITALIWLSVHLPFVMGFTLAAATLSKIVLAHDNPGSDPDHLADTYAVKSESELSIGLYWFYCAGLSVSLFCMTAIAESHESKQIPGQRMPKWARSLYRCFVALIILLLPLAHEHLTSLKLVATTTGLVVSILIVDLAGLSCTGDVFWGFNDKRLCNYSANCKISNKELAEKIRKGEVVDVEALAMKSGTKGEENHDMIV